MLDKTLGYILCCQSPGLFLAAAVLVIAYFAGRKKHRFKAVLKLLLEKEPPAEAVPAVDEPAADAPAVTPEMPAEEPVQAETPEAPAQTEA